MVTWVIQTNFIDPIQISQIIDVLDSNSIPYVGVHLLPFTDELTLLGSLPEGNKVVPYGTCKLTRLAQLHNWTGMFFDEHKFRVDTWLKNRNDMLNGDVQIMTAKEAAVCFASVPADDMYFIRPVKDLKEFNGTVTNAAEISRWTKSVESGNFDVSEDTLVAISPAQKIHAEWRWFIVGGKVVSGSVYRMRGQKLVQREHDIDVINQAQSLADKWLPHETCVMDVAYTPNGVKVIEFNCFNSSGFYYHDINAIVLAVTKYLEGK